MPEMTRTKGIPFEAEGWMLINSKKSTKSWKRRFTELTFDGVFTYYRSPGKIPQHLSFNIKMSKIRADHDGYLFEISSGDSILLLKMKNSDEFHQWSAAFYQHIRSDELQCRRTYYQLLDLIKSRNTDRCI